MTVGTNFSDFCTEFCRKSLIGRLANEVNIPIAVFGDFKACEDIKKKHPELYDYILQRPLTSSEAAMMIADYAAVSEAKKKMEREEAEYIASRRNVPAKPQQNDEPVFEAPVPEAEIADKSASGERKRLLVIDDDRQVLKVLKWSLKPTTMSPQWQTARSPKSIRKLTQPI